MPARLPCAPGVGLGLRWSFSRAASERPLPDALSFFEVTPENYVGLGGPRMAELEIIAHRRPLVSHGLSLNLGGVDRAEAIEPAGLASFLARFGLTGHSDHLCWTAHNGVSFHELLPVERTDETIARITTAIVSVQAALGVPLAIENITAYASPGVRPMPESEFLSRVITDADCGLLLDVTNLWINALNDSGANSSPASRARATIDALPIDRVVQLHVAGGRIREDLGGLWIDDHATSVPDAVVELTQYVLSKTGPLPVCYERDNALPEFDALLAEVERLAGALELSGPANARAAAAGSRAVADTSGSGLTRECGTNAMLADVLRRGDSAAAAPAAKIPGFPGDRIEVYRALVGETLRFPAHRFLPRAAALRGDEFSSDLDDWIREHGPRSAILRDLAAEFVAWVTHRWAPNVALVDLANYELARHAVVTRVREPGRAGVTHPLAVDEGVEVGSIRLLHLDHAVHVQVDSAPVPRETRIVVYCHEGRAQTMELDEFEFTLLSALERGATVKNAVASASGASPGTIDHGSLRRAADLLARLSHLGILPGVT